MTDEVIKPPPPPRKPGRPPKAYSLRSLMDIREEMVRVYREMRADRIAIGTGFSLVQVLSICAKVTEVTQGQGLIDRLAKLEAQRDVSTADERPDSAAH